MSRGVEEAVEVEAGDVGTAVPSAPPAEEQPLELPTFDTASAHDLCAAAYFGIAMARCSPVAPSSTVCYVFESTPLNGACDLELSEAIVCGWIVGSKYYSQLWAVQADVKRCGDEDLGQQ